VSVFLSLQMILPTLSLCPTVQLYLFGFDALCVPDFSWQTEIYIPFDEALHESASSEEVAPSLAFSAFNAII
jgi:hypothetical protein